jgi:indolepyruvate decarboxylase
LSSQYAIGHYLLQRLRELGISSVFGVPGDYILDLIEMICDEPDLTWVGNCNELNAAYAADGFGRVNGAAALVVTGGVGDLGAAGGIGGAFAENVPVVVISGVPGPGAGPGGRSPAIHHSLGDGEFSPYSRIFAELTATQTLLNPDNAASEIDRVCTHAWRDKRPVFIALPADVAAQPTAPPDSPLDLHAPLSDPAELADFLTRVAQMTSRSETTVVLADVGVRQSRAVGRFIELVDATGVRWASTWAATWDFDTTRPGYLGTYMPNSAAAEAVNNAATLIRLGARLDEFGLNKADPDYAGPELIDIAAVGARIGNVGFATLRLTEVLAHLQQSLPKMTPAPLPAAPRRPPFVVESEAALRQDRLWECFAEYIRPGDNIVVDIGTASVGLRSITLPEKASVMSQNIWGAIGWSLPALLGASLADRSKRPVLLVGDGAFALTMQEISTMLRTQIAPLLVVLNNTGYLIEDLVGGRRIACNDLWNWKYAALPDAFDGDEAFKPLGLRARTEQELADALHAAGQAQAEGRLVLLEAVVDRSDFPRLANLGN